MRKWAMLPAAPGVKPPDHPGGLALMFGGGSAHALHIFGPFLDNVV